jgi:hypothetical protein
MLLHGLTKCTGHLGRFKSYLYLILPLNAVIVNTGCCSYQ